jgi:hypothetical protein
VATLEESGRSEPRLLRVSNLLHIMQRRRKQGAQSGPPCMSWKLAAKMASITSPTADEGNRPDTGADRLPFDRRAFTRSSLGRRRPTRNGSPYFLLLDRYEGLKSRFRMMEHHSPRNGAKRQDKTNRPNAGAMRDTYHLAKRPALFLSYAALVTCRRGRCFKRRSPAPGCHLHDQRETPPRHTVEC